MCTEQENWALNAASIVLQRAGTSFFILLVAEE